MAKNMVVVGKIWIPHEISERRSRLYTYAYDFLFGHEKPRESVPMHVISSDVNKARTLKPKAKAIPNAKDYDKK